MEITAALFILITSVLFFFWLGRSRDDQAAPSTKQTSSVRDASCRASPVEQPPRFDEQSAKRRPRSLEGAVYVTDGDTIKIKNTQIRLFGIDAPELNHPYGQKAKWALHKLCKGQIVRAEITEVDQYGRTVARCYLSDGRELSAEMVKLGLAIDWPKYSGGKFLHLETSDVRKRLFLADARQKGRMYIWESFEARQGDL